MQNDGSCLHIHSFSLCLFTEELSPLILTDIDVQQLLIPFDLMLMVKLSVVVYVCEIVPVLLVLII